MKFHENKIFMNIPKFKVVYIWKTVDTESDYQNFAASWALDFKRRYYEIVEIGKIVVISSISLVNN